MILTGKCKEDFEKWLFDTEIEIDFLYWANPYKESLDDRCFKFFYSSPLSMQYGVYVDFFDSFGIVIKNGNKHFRINTKKYNTKTRQESRTKAIEKANEIYNNQ